MDNLVWKKSSYSGRDGCVEVQFIKSSRSGTGGCVEVAKVKELPATMLRPVTFDDEPDGRIKAVKMVPYEEDEDSSW